MNLKAILIVKQFSVMLLFFAVAFISLWREKYWKNRIFAVEKQLMECMCSLHGSCGDMYIGAVETSNKKMQVPLVIQSLFASISVFLANIGIKTIDFFRYDLCIILLMVEYYMFHPTNLLGWSIDSKMMSYIARRKPVSNFIFSIIFLFGSIAALAHLISPQKFIVTFIEYLRTWYFCSPIAYCLHNIIELYWSATNLTTSSYDESWVNKILLPIGFRDWHEVYMMFLWIGGAQMVLAPFQFFVDEIVAADTRRGGGAVCVARSSSHESLVVYILAMISVTCFVTCWAHFTHMIAFGSPPLRPQHVGALNNHRAQSSALVVVLGVVSLGACLALYFALFRAQNWYEIAMAMCLPCVHVGLLIGTVPVVHAQLQKFEFVSYMESHFISEIARYRTNDTGSKLPKISNNDLDCPKPDPSQLSAKATFDARAIFDALLFLTVQKFVFLGLHLKKHRDSDSDLDSDGKERADPPLLAPKLESEDASTQSAESGPASLAASLSAYTLRLTCATSRDLQGVTEWRRVWIEEFGGVFAGTVVENADLVYSSIFESSVGRGRRHDQPAAETGGAGHSTFGSILSDSNLSENSVAADIDCENKKIIPVDGKFYGYFVRRK